MARPAKTHVRGRISQATRKDTEPGTSDGHRGRK